MKKKCVVCGRESVIVIRRANVGFCAEHFIEYYERMIIRTLKKAGFKGGKVLIAVSGGKDSMALLHALSNVRDEINIEVSALQIDLGIGSYSEKSKEIVEKEIARLGIDYFLVRAENYVGVSIPEAVKYAKKPACSICGLVKRWIMNKVAYENGFDYIATGHNLDDVSTYFLKATFTYRKEDLLRGNEIISPPKPELKMVGRIRPQIFLTERENQFYCLVKDIEFVDIECPLSRGALIKRYKMIWNEALELNPMSQYNFTRTILSIREKISRIEPEIKPCLKCGYPTTSRDQICSFCKLKEKVNMSKNTDLSSR